MGRICKGIVFDMDGTLTVPFLDFSYMRARLDLLPEDDIVEKLNSMSGAERVRAEALIREVEEEALRNTTLQPGLTELMVFIESLGIPKAILTRNALASVEHVLDNYIPKHKFEVIVTRQFVPPKPAPDALHHIAAFWDVKASDLIMVGDMADDILCAKAAGSTSILLRNSKNAHVEEHADFVVDSLHHIIQLIDKGDILFTST
ncbi:HAD-like domain-containing protein [Gaertneriomyces semiglobifer]|nr:HAD-like domain-containing protein [Gaertneriomyces semiglobifer]